MIWPFSIIQKRKEARRVACLMVGHDLAEDPPNARTALGAYGLAVWHRPCKRCGEKFDTWVAGIDRPRPAAMLRIRR